MRIVLDKDRAGERDVWFLRRFTGALGEGQAFGPAECSDTLVDGAAVTANTAGRVPALRELGE
ncbi:hypothetical protein [Roseateles amylovorans]|uniref:Uncharacterized protein n=1 Tax=Roseateles amylovorans TaxID=2978473 RepID=A0ABY6AVD5_9BURK|nr:hypothetical protein [Roseateles amylovorans]UXH77161.1 hypothetical protein N4261_19395 [Roseateles amylovorans]